MTGFLAIAEITSLLKILTETYISEYLHIAYCPNGQGEKNEREERDTKGRADKWDTEGYSHICSETDRRIPTDAKRSRSEVFGIIAKDFPIGESGKCLFREGIGEVG